MFQPASQAGRKWRIGDEICENLWKIEKILEEIIQNEVSLEGSPTIKVTLLLQLLLLMVDAQDSVNVIHIPLRQVLEGSKDNANVKRVQSPLHI